MLLEHSRVLVAEVSTGLVVGGGLGSQAAEGEALAALGDVLEHQAIPSAAEASSFSIQDIIVAAANQFIEMRVVTPSARFRMIPALGWPAALAIQRAFYEAEAKARNRVKQMVITGELPLAYAAAELQHQRWAIVSVEFDLGYQREGS